MAVQRYNAKNTVKALTVLGFNVRDPDGGSTIFCIHTLTKEEVCIPKTENGFLEDVLASIFQPINLRFIFFKAVYISSLGGDQYPSDQN